MRNENDQLGVPGYISIKEAAEKLGLSPSRVYEYVEDGRLSSVRAAHVILIPLEEIENFKPKLAGRPRRSIPRWRISPKENMLLSTTISVQMRTNREDELMKRLVKIKQEEQFLFPGTVSRSIIRSETLPGHIEISLIWRSTVMPSEEARKQALEKFQHALEDVLDWSTAQYESGQVMMHT